MKRARAEILSTRKIGAYQSITLVAPEIAERSRPGQFLAIAMPEGREFVLRRHFSVHQASRQLAAPPGLTDTAPGSTYGRAATG